MSRKSKIYDVFFLNFTATLPPALYIKGLRGGSKVAVVAVKGKYLVVFVGKSWLELLHFRGKFCIFATDNNYV